MKKYILKLLKRLGFNFVTVEGWVELECKDRFGNLKWSWSGHNGITNAGFAQLALLAGDATAVPFTYLAVGTSTTAFSAAQTALIAEVTDTGLARVSATVSRVTTTQTNDTLQLVYTWTATGTKAIEEVGVFNAGSSGTMLGRALTTTKTVTNTDQLLATYKVKFS
jgi:hypothetical protein